MRAALAPSPIASPVSSPATTPTPSPKHSQTPSPQCTDPNSSPRVALQRERSLSITASDLSNSHHLTTVVENSDSYHTATEHSFYGDREEGHERQDEAQTEQLRRATLRGAQLESVLKHQAEEARLSDLDSVGRQNAAREAEENAALHEAP